MTFVALWIPASTDGEPADTGSTDSAIPAAAPSSPVGLPLVDAFLETTPHVVVEPREDGTTLVWADARGLSARAVARDTLRIARRTLPAASERLRVGVSRVALVAEVAALTGERTVVGVSPRSERDFMATQPIKLLLDTGACQQNVSKAALDRIVTGINRLGIRSCGQLAALASDDVAVRFGATGAMLWQLARGHDTRTLFTRSARQLPSASLAWTTYELRDPERLAFIAHRLVGQVMAGVREWGDAARILVLRFALASGSAHETPVRAARPTAETATWSRLVRAALERVTLPDGVTGLALRVEAATQLDAPQGDLFDRGFQDATIAEQTVAQVVDDGLGEIVALTRTGHPTPERRVTKRPLAFQEIATAIRSIPASTQHSADTNEAEKLASDVLDIPRHRRRPTARGAATVHDEALALRLLHPPREIVVATRQRRDADMPVHYRERLPLGARAPRGLPLVSIVEALGPDALDAGSAVGEPVDRLYWQCLTDDGRFVLIYQDRLNGVPCSEARGPSHPSPDPSPDTSPDISSDTKQNTVNQSLRHSWFLHGWWD